MCAFLLGSNLCSIIYYMYVPYTIKTVCYVLEIRCIAPENIPNGKYSQMLNQTFPVRTTLTWSCTEGYTSEQNKSRVCQSNLNWTNEEPTCTEITCQFPDIFSNGELEVTNGSMFRSGYVPYNTRAIVVCEEGFLPDPPAIACTSNSTWDTTPTCSPIMCERLGSVTGGYFVYSNTSDQTAASIHAYGTVATVVCNDTLFKASEGQLICGLNGDWIGSESIRVCGRCIIPVNRIKKIAFFVKSTS